MCEIYPLRLYVDLVSLDIIANSTKLTFHLNNPELQAPASREGWIALPTAPLATLA
jgi:hypothetical protein